MEFLQQYQGLAVLAGTLLLGVFGVFFRAQVMALVQDKASAGALSDLALQLRAHDARLITMEAAIRHLPTADQMTALTVAVTDLRGEVREVRAKVGGVEKAMDTLTRRFDLVDEHLKRAAGGV